MAEPTVMLLVRFKSSLSFDEVMEVVETRADEFRALGGLTQKYYLHDPVSGECGGLYLWDSPASLESYRGSKLRATIAEAYRVEGEPHIEVFEVVKTLRADGD